MVLVFSRALNMTEPLTENTKKKQFIIPESFVKIIVFHPWYDTDESDTNLM